MFVDVKVENKKYTYNCNLDVTEGDYVKVPFGDVVKTGRILEIGVPMPTFDTKDVIDFSDAPSEDDVEGVVDTLAVRKLNDISKMEIDVENVWLKLASMLPNPKYIVVTEDNYKDVKGSVTRTLRNAEKDLDEARKTPQRIFNEARATYNDGMNELIKRVHKRVEEIKAKTDEFDEKVRAEHEKIAVEAIDKFAKKFELEPIFAERLEVRNEYLNLSANKKGIETSIQNDAEQLAMTQENYHTRLESIKVIIDEVNKNLTNKLEVKDYEKMTLESSLAMEPHSVVINRIREDGARRAEMERKAIEAAKRASEIKAEEEKKRAEAEQKAAEEAEFMAQNQKPKALDEKEEVVEETLFVKATRRQLSEIMNFAKKIGAEIEIGF